MKLRMGENIRRHRHALGLTQEQLGEKLGVSYQAISRWENGTAYPDIEFLQPVLLQLDPIPCKMRQVLSRSGSILSGFAVDAGLLQIQFFL